MDKTLWLPPLDPLPVREGEEERLLTAEEAAEVLRCAAATVYRLIRSGELRAVRIGKLVRVRRADLGEFVKGRVK